MLIFVAPILCVVTVANVCDYGTEQLSSQQEPVRRTKLLLTPQLSLLPTKLPHRAQCRSGPPLTPHLFLSTYTATTLFLPSFLADGLTDLEGKIQLLKAQFVVVFTHLFENGL